MAKFKPGDKIRLTPILNNKMRYGKIFIIASINEETYTIQAPNGVMTNFNIEHIDKVCEIFMDGNDILKDLCSK